MSNLKIEKFKGNIEDMQYKVVYYTTDRKDSFVMGIFPTKFLAQAFIKAIED